MYTTRSLLITLALPWAATALPAQSPFGVTVASSTLPTLNVGYASFPDLLSAVLNAKQEFAAYGQADFNAAFTFLGVPNAIVAASNATGTQVQIQIPGIGFSQTWTGPDRATVQSEIQNFFTKNGTKVEGNFLKYIAQTSPLAVTDGNPNASTARMATTSFTRFGFTPLADTQGSGGPASGSSTLTGNGAGNGKPGLSSFGIGLNSGRFNAAGLQGQNSEIDLPFHKQLTDRVGLDGVIPLDYLDINGGKAYGIGLVMGLPVRIVTRTAEQPWTWRVTPMLGVSARGSKDLAGGGLIYDAGLTSCEGIALGKVVLDFVTQYAAYRSATVAISSYKFNPDVDQGILKNGVRLSSSLAPKVRYDVYLVTTDFVHAAAVKSFTTYGGSLCYLTGARFNVTVGANFDNGNNFKAWSAGLSSAWAF